MMHRRKPTEAALRAAERRQREDAAERLSAQVPRLQTLELAISESRSGAPIGETRHVRRFVVESAPALFELACADRACSGGGHEITREVLGALRAGRTRFEGEHTCTGTVAGAPCDRVMRYAGVATYRDA